MTRVFVYEYCTAVGLGRAAADPAHSLFREGAAMRDAVAADFARAPGVTVTTLDSDDAAGDRQRFTARTADADAVLVIAPEFGGLLAERCGWVRAAGKLSLNPSADAIALTADKLALARHWQAAGVPTPRTWRVGEPPLAAHPIVWKPRYGAGSVATLLIRRPEDEGRFATLFRPEDVPTDCWTDRIAQEYHPGRPASVAFLVGPRAVYPLAPTFQRLSTDDCLAYEGGELPIPPDVAARAVAIGTKSVTSVEGLSGYVGVDLVLGEAPDGSEDVAIEINPRLTTSYLGLRAATDSNIAEEMILAAQGMPVRELQWSNRSIKFSIRGHADSKNV